MLCWSSTLQILEDLDVVDAFCGAGAISAYYSQKPKTLQAKQVCSNLLWATTSVDLGLVW